MQRVTFKYVQNAMLIFTITVLSVALLVEYNNNLEPCPLCVMQRMCAFMMGFLCFISLSMASIHRVKIITASQILLALLGIYFASRQIWLQSLPAGNGKMCMPVFEMAKRSELFKTYFWGTANCSEVTWSALGLSMPGWALLYFIIMVVANVSLLAFLQQKLDALNK